MPPGNNPGRIIGGVTLGQSGPLAAGGGAFNFDGSTGFIATQQRLSNPTKLSIVFWVNLARSTGTIMGLNTAPFASSFGFTYVYLLSNPLLGFTPNNGTPGGVASASVPPLGIWTMVTVLSNGSAYTVTLNKAYLAPTSGESAPTGYQGWWMLGATASSGGYNQTGNRLKGMLAEVAVYHGTVITETQHNAIYDAASSASPTDYPDAVMASNPTSYWRLNEVSGLYIHDQVLPHTV